LYRLGVIVKLAETGDYAVIIYAGHNGTVLVAPLHQAGFPLPDDAVAVAVDLGQQRGIVRCDLLRAITPAEISQSVDRLAQDDRQKVKEGVKLVMDL